MVWEFQRSLAGHLSNPDDKEEYQSELYKKINPNTPKAIIAVTHCPNCAMHKISTFVNFLPIHILRRNNIDNEIMNFEDTCRWCKCLFSSPISVFYTRHTACFVTVWKLLLTFGLYKDFRGLWNHVAMILLVAVISIFLFSIEKLSVQSE